MKNQSESNLKLYRELLTTWKVAHDKYILKRYCDDKPGTVLQLLIMRITILHLKVLRDQMNQSADINWAKTFGRHLLLNDSLNNTNTILHTFYCKKGK